MMMHNMFSMFDPSSSLMCSNWVVVTTIFLAVKPVFLKKNTKIWVVMKNLMANINKEIKQMAEKKIKTTNSMFSAMFMCIFTLNLIAIFPYNFTVTAHISITFTFSMSMWLSTMIFGWGNYFKSMMLHLTPMGTPNTLMNFMVIIEAISSMIRPITLSIRLSANMVAGHLLMSLLSSFSMSSAIEMVISMTPMMALISLEIGVAVVQAYVLMTLLLLYQNETT